MYANLPRLVAGGYEIYVFDSWVVEFFDGFDDVDDGTSGSDTYVFCIWIEVLIDCLLRRVAFRCLDIGGCGGHCGVFGGKAAGRAGGKRRSSRDLINEKSSFPSTSAIESALGNTSVTMTGNINDSYLISGEYAVNNRCIQ